MKYFSRSELINLASTMLVIMFVLPVLAFGQWRDPFETKPPTGQPLITGGYLERVFQRFLENGCFIIPTAWARADKSGKPTKRLMSSVPLRLQGEVLTLSVPVETQWDRSLATVFAYAYRPNERTSIPSFEEKRTLDLDLLADPSTMVPVGASNVRYVHTCGSMLFQTANANANFKVPLASLEAGLKAEYESTSQPMVGLVEGTFTSPIEALVNKGGEKKLFAYFLFWDWYDRARPTVGEENYYLKRFEGISATYINRTRTSFEGSLNLKGEIAVAVAGAKAQTNASQNQTVLLNATGYSTAAYNQSGGKQRDDSDYEIIPDISTLTGFIKSSAVPKIQVDNRTLKFGGEHFHKQTVDGIPKGLCKPNNWTIQTNNLGLMLIDVTPSEENTSSGVDRCIFTLKYEPPSNLFSNPTPANAGDLEYKLTTNKVGIENVEISVPKITYVVSNYPKIERDPSFNGILTANPVISGGETIQQLFGTVPLKIRDAENDKVNWSQSSELSPMQLTCNGEANPIPVNVSIVSRVQDESNVTKIVLQVSRSVTSSDNRDFSLPKIQCKLNGSITFNMVTSANEKPRKVTKELEDIILSYPALKSGQ